MATSDTFNVTGPHGGQSVVGSYFLRDRVTAADRSIAASVHINEMSATNGGGTVLFDMWVDAGDLTRDLYLAGLTVAQLVARVLTLFS